MRADIENRQGVEIAIPVTTAEPEPFPIEDFDGLMAEAAEMEIDDDWYEVHGNLVDLAYWLEEHTIEFADKQAIIRYFEKPWAYTPEYRAYLLAKERGQA